MESKFPGSQFKSWLESLNLSFFLHRIFSKSASQDFIPFQHFLEGKVYSEKTQIILFFQSSSSRGEILFCISMGFLWNIFCEVLGKISDKESSPGTASPQGRGPYLFKEEIRPKEGPNFHHQGVIMICDITSDSNTFDYFLEEALVKRSVEPAEIALLKTSPLNSLIGVKPVNNRAKQGKWSMFPSAALHIRS